MGELQRGFIQGYLNEDLIENIDETHFIVDIDNKMMVGFRGDDCVKYADIIFGGLKMTMII